MGSGLDVKRLGGARIRVGPWRGDAQVGYLAPLGDGPGPGVGDVRAACDRLAAAGYRDAVTAALGPVEAHGFLLAGFEVRERLHLLDRDLHDRTGEGPQNGGPPTASSTLRRARRRDRGRVLAIDAAAFSPFWRLDEAGLDEALTATPASRFRVAELEAVEPALVGYAVWGRAGRRGFLQRLAIDPARHGHGLGRALVLDGFSWLRRRGVDRVVVNTQEGNQRALELYEGLGFRRQPDGLAVLHKTL